MIEAVITGDREVIARFRALPGAVRASIVTVMRRLMITLQARVKADQLSGQVLKNRTGNLRQSIAQEVSIEPTGITGRVGIFGGPTIAYGRAHEFGFDGTVSVQAHLRTITQAFGVPIAPRAIEVAAHTREVHLPERSFLRSALAEMAPTIGDELRGAVSTAIQGAA